MAPKTTGRTVKPHQTTNHKSTKEIIDLINNTMLTLTAFASRLGQQKFTTDPSGNVVNLSKHSFTKPQYELLNKNLNFCPKPSKFNIQTFKEDIKKFKRKIKLKAFFTNPDEESNPDQNDKNST